MNSVMEPLLLKPRTIYDSLSNLRNESLNCASKHSTSSKVQEFLSRHKSYIRHKRANFHRADKCLPKQFLLPTTKSNTLCCKTQLTPKKQNTQPHNTGKITMKQQMIHQLPTTHKQHQSTSVIPLFLRISLVKIFPKDFCFYKKQTSLQ